MQNARWAYTLLGLGFILLMLGFGAFSSKEGAQPSVGESSEQITLPTGTLAFGDTVIDIEIAQTPSERTKGLSGRGSLEEGTGLFFIFENADRHGFWMPDMHFAIDIIWLDQDLRVVAIKENATPESYPAVFQPSAPALYVLEVPAFYSAKAGISAGSTATFARN